MKLKGAVLIASLLITGFAQAEGKHWRSGAGSSVVSIAIHKAKVTASVGSNAPTELQTVNSMLLKEHGDSYVKVKDFNADGKMDVGVMKGAGYGGSNACYAVYELNTTGSSYQSKASMTACPQ